jgi:hypothetical protein
MITDINEIISAEINVLIEALTKSNPDFRVEDLEYLVLKTPFLTNPDAKNEEWKNKIGIVMYPELLSYSDHYIDRGNPEVDSAGSRNYKVKSVTVPWICVRFELEGEQPIAKDLCKWLVQKFKDIGYYPFMDEDAAYNHFAKDERRGYTKYKMYVNPSYPEGLWENHTL